MVVVMRALIMLLVLIVVPLLVVFGSSLGDWPQEMAIDAWARLTDTTAAAVTTEPKAGTFPDDDAGNVAPRFLDTVVPEGPVTEGPVLDTSALATSAPATSAPAGKKPVALANFEEPVRRVVAEPQHQAAVVDRYTTIQQRLRELGAVYFRLDRLGGPHGGYRFHCEFEDADGPFTASDVDLLQSMESVLQRVERWKDGQRG